VNTNETETTEYESFLAELQFQRERAEACGVYPEEAFLTKARVVIGMCIKTPFGISLIIGFSYWLLRLIFRF
jgi:hypothetical protein